MLWAFGRSSPLHPSHSSLEGAVCFYTEIHAGQGRPLTACGPKSLTCSFLSQSRHQPPYTPQGGGPAAVSRASAAIQLRQDVGGSMQRVGSGLIEVRKTVRKLVE